MPAATSRTVAGQLAAFLSGDAHYAATSLRPRAASPYRVQQTVTCPVCNGSGWWIEGVACDTCRSYDFRKRGAGSVTLEARRTALYSGRELIAVLCGDVDYLADPVRREGIARQGGLLVLDAIPTTAPSVALATDWARRGFDSEEFPSTGPGRRPARAARALALYATTEPRTPIARRHVRMLREAAASGQVIDHSGQALRVACMPVIDLSGATLAAVADATEHGVKDPLDGAAA